MGILQSIKESCCKKQEICSKISKIYANNLKELFYSNDKTEVNGLNVESCYNEHASYRALSNSRLVMLTPISKLERTLTALKES